MTEIDYEPTDEKVEAVRAKLYGDGVVLSVMNIFLVLRADAKVRAQQEQGR